MKATEQKQRRNFLITTIGVIIMLILMATSSVIFAQPSGRQQGPPPTPNSKQIKKMVAKLADEIQLNDKQETKVLAIYQDHFADVKKATNSGRPDRSKMEKLKTQMETDIKAVLNEKQIEGYEAYLKKQEKQQRRSRPE
ncbi:hypothetical protein [uncultured Draconibacterium sp.]|uniref:hypothetical protein n=1 Tax=uncultured Draconibacterium sp. TaxID=1573823 RepID=UPI002AA7506D|nr:hypothetical protein [uncultured Draconibacterium sp.]